MALAVTCAPNKNTPSFSFGSQRGMTAALNSLSLSLPLALSPSEAYVRLGPNQFLCFFNQKTVCPFQTPCLVAESDEVKKVTNPVVK
jgi:hypothetical protein